MPEEMVTISKKEYDALKKKAEDFDFWMEWNVKKGERFKKLMALKDFDHYMVSVEHNGTYIRIKENYQERLKFGKVD